jgi:hypothetical protein
MGVKKNENGTAIFNGKLTEMGPLKWGQPLLVLKKWDRHFQLMGQLLPTVKMGQPLLELKWELKWDSHFFSAFDKRNRTAAFSILLV